MAGMMLLVLYNVYLDGYLCEKGVGLLDPSSFKQRRVRMRMVTSGSLPIHKPL